MKELYQAILFDDGIAPKEFNKENLLVSRHEINELLNADVRLSNQNLRDMRSQNLGTGPMYGLRLGPQGEVGTE